MTNLLRNGSFDAEDIDGPGSAYIKFPPGTLSGLMPEYWYLVEYSRPGDPKLPSQDQDWGSPEIIPIKWHRQFPERELLYPPLPAVPPDEFILKGFRGGQPVYYKLGQTVKAAPAGQYVFTAPVFPDQWTWDRKRPGNPPGSADWYYASEVGLQVNTPDASYQTGWQDARTVPIGVYTPVQLRFNHPGGDLNVFIAARGRWGFQENGWFWDGITLEATTTPVPAPAPQPQPTPNPAPIPQPGTIQAAQAAMAVAQANINARVKVLQQLIGDADADAALIRTVQDSLK